MRRVDPGLRDWIEQLAMALERDGLPRMAGRILGWLLVCEPAEQTMEDLAAALQGSKASMSTMTRLLMGADLIERTRPPGSRRDHFRFRTAQAERLWASRMDMLREVRGLMERGLDLTRGRAPGAQARVRELHDLYAFFEQELPVLLARFARRRAAPPPPPRARPARARSRGRG
ncbi:MAG: MarR family transcriptional regulator [Anaeromyxobacter sp.]